MNELLDITCMAQFTNEIPESLVHLGYKVYQVMEQRTGTDITTCILPPMKEVPAGPFTMGTDMDQFSNAPNGEGPKHTVEVAAFHMSVFPLTVAEYAYFTTAFPSYALPINWGSQLPNLDFPVVGIDWLSAVAYTRWLSDTTNQAHWSLPYEAEWEKAARGTDERRYPWGNICEERCANYGNSPFHLRPIGLYPQGASPYGVQEMAGTVEEWCQSRQMRYPYKSTPEREGIDTHMGDRRVVRGGSYLSAPSEIRCSRRYAVSVEYAQGARGARLVLRG